MASIADLFGRLLLDDTGFEASVMKSAQKAGDTAGVTLGQSLSKSFKAVGLAAIATVFAGASRTAIELDTAVKQYAADVGASAEESDKAKAAASDLFKVNRQGYAEILQTLGKLRTEQGLSIEEASKLADQYLKFAKVAGTDAPNAVKLFDDIQDAWNLTAADGVRVMDLLVASNQKFGGSLVQRAADLKALAPALQGLNLEVDDGIALENLFAASGLNASDAQRALNTAVKNLKPGQSFDDLIRQISAIEDPTLRAQEAIRIFGVRGGTALAQAFRPGITSLQDFGIAATDAAGSVKTASDSIDSSIPAQFQLALKSIQGSIADLVGPGGAIISMISSLSLLTIAFDTLKDHAIASWLATLGPAALIAGAGAAFLLALGALEDARKRDVAAAGEQGKANSFLATVFADVAAGTKTFDQAQAELLAAYKEGVLGTDDYQAAIRGLNDAHALLAQTAGPTERAIAGVAASEGSAATASDAAATAAAGLTAAARGVTDAQLRVAQATVDAAAAHTVLAAAQKTAEDSATAGAEATVALAVAQAADTAASAALKAAQDALAASLTVVRVGLGGYVDDLLGAGKGTDALSDALLRAANSATIAKGDIEDAGTAAVNALAALIAMHAEGTGDLGAVQDREARDREQRRLEAERLATQASSEHARVVKGELTDAFRSAKSAADTFFDSLHRHNLDAIADANRTANDLLEAQKKALFLPVDEAQAALDAKRKADQRKGLQKGVATAALGIAEAQAGGDPKAILAAVQQVQSARQALADFDAQATIDEQRAAAQANVDKLTAQQKANDDAAALAVTAEDARAAAQKKAFDDGLAKLETQLTTEKGSHTKTLAAIAALYATAGIDTKGQGAQIALGLAAGLLSEVKAVENAAKTLAQAVAKYIKTGSPAEAGPFHEMAPDVMGRKIAVDFGKALFDGLVDLGPAMKVLASGLQLPSISPAFAAGGAIAPSAASAAVPALAGGTGDLHVHVDLGEEFARQFGGNRFIDKVSQGLAWRRRSTS